MTFVAPGVADRAVALAILGIVVSLALAILVALDAPTASIVISGLATIVVIVAIYSPTLRYFYRNGREELERRTLRKRRSLRLVALEEMEQAPTALPDGVYGFEEIFAVAGLRADGPHANEARIKPDRRKANGEPYPLEVHKYAGETWLVGYVEPDQRALAWDTKSVGQVTLWMRRTDRATALVPVALLRVGPEKSLGDRSLNSSEENIYRLVLDIRPSNGPSSETARGAGTSD
jgi:hypothetical protein